MKRVGVIACSARKAPGYRAWPARDLYQGALFHKALCYCERLIDAGQLDACVILSARWGVVELDEPLERYDQRLPGSKRARAGWAVHVASDLRKRFGDARYVALCGRQYVEAVEATGCPIERPLAGCRGIGEMLRRLNDLLDETPVTRWIPYRK